MVSIPDSVCSLFSATIREQDDTYIVEIPSDEIEHGTLTAGETYRVAVLQSRGSSEPSESTAQSTPVQPRSRRDDKPPGPPVDEGEVRHVTIETIGDQGDGIAKVERGYVVIVPEARPGDTPGDFGVGEALGHVLSRHCPGLVASGIRFKTL